MRSAAITAMLLLSTGCTIVRVESAGAVKVHAVAGVLKIEAGANSSDVVAYRVRGFGLVPTLGGLTLGYSAEDVVLLKGANACRIIVFELPNLPEAADAWRRLLDERPEICIHGGKAHEMGAN
jgi:hypothetical protein